MRAIKNCFHLNSTLPCKTGRHMEPETKTVSVTLSLAFIYSHESFGIEPLNLASDMKKAKYQDSLSLRKGQRHYLKVWPQCQDQLVHSSLAAIHQAWAQYFKIVFSIYSPSLMSAAFMRPSAPQRTSWQGYCLPNTRVFKEYGGLEACYTGKGQITVGKTHSPSLPYNQLTMDVLVKATATQFSGLS